MTANQNHILTLFKSSFCALANLVCDDTPLNLLPKAVFTGTNIHLLPLSSLGIHGHPPNFIDIRVAK